MFKSIRKKKGSSSVFLMIILGSMVSLTCAFVVLSMRTAGESIAGGVFFLAGRSVLAEYDTELKERYGIFAFVGDDITVNSKLRSYASASFDEKPNMRIDSIEVDMKEHCLMDREEFTEEICACVLQEAAGELTATLLSDEKTVRPPVITGERRLQNSITIGALPSNGMTDRAFDISELINSIKDGFPGSLWESASTSYLIDRYMFTHFRNGQNQDIPGACFFKNEIEYIICGKKSDKANRAAIDAQLTLLRVSMNTIYLTTNKEKQLEIETMAQLMTPGPEAALTQVLLTELWATAEAAFDLSILSEGGRVPMFKSDSSWVTDLDGAVNGGTEKLMAPENQKGLNYEDYLKIFAACISEEVKVARMMDLIQINLQGTYNGSFRIGNCYTGFVFDAKVNGKKLHFEETY